MRPQYEENDNFVRLTQENGVILVIPKNEANADYQRYLRWLENPDADEAQSL
jgi:hypothetical protein